MTKKCLLVQSKNSADWAIQFFRDINQGMLDNDVDTVLGIAAPEELGKLWSDYIDSLEPGSTINIFGMNTFPRIDAQSLPPKIAGLNSISWMGDSPANQVDRINGLSQSTHLAFVDHGHLDMCTEFNLDFPMSFMPHGGPPVDDTQKDFEDRDIDFLFSGTLNDVLSKDDWKQNNPGVPDIIANLIFSTSEQMVSECITPLNAWSSCCSDIGFDYRENLSVVDTLRTLAVIEGLAQSLRRKNILTAIDPARSLYIATPTLPDYLVGRPNLEYHGYNEFYDLYALFKRTRIVLNPQCKFSQGSHERIWYSMATGAVVATDESTFVSKSFNHGESIMVLPWHNECEEFGDINELARDDKALTSMRDTALPIYSENHLWRHRVKQIADLLQ
jgi:hypothetical protein